MVWKQIKHDISLRDSCQNVKYIQIILPTYFNKQFVSKCQMWVEQNTKQHPEMAGMYVCSSQKAESKTI